MPERKNPRQGRGLSMLFGGPVAQFRIVVGNQVVIAGI